MRQVTLAILAFLVASPVAAQHIIVGPGGVGVEPRERYHEYGGGYGGRSEYCHHLRKACEHKYERGEEGMGNCRRYHERCG